MSGSQERGLLILCVFSAQICCHKSTEHFQVSQKEGLLFSIRDAIFGLGVMTAVTKTPLGEIWSCLGNKGGVQ